MLEVRDIRVSYGAAAAIAGVSLVVEKGDLVVIVGPNGAGKTTLVNALAGLHPLDSGSLTMDGRDLTRLSAHRYCDEGIALVPEGRRLFTGLTVKENLELGSYRAGARARRAETMNDVCAIFPVLKERLESPAGTLSGGQQQMLAIARALMARPRLLLLDEPSLGLAPKLVHEMFRLIREINRRGVTILLVEQNARQALRISHRAYVLEKGLVSMSGIAQSLASDPRVVASYLGS
jgi:branched-chain amino acid transport system ATP-binding protein